jgi:tetratricopeptide (TPR) repeat protein
MGGTPPGRRSGASVIAVGAKHSGERKGKLAMRRFPWRWVLAGFVILASAAIFIVDRRGPEAVTRRGRALVNSKEYAQAIDHFNRAIEIDPTYAPAYHGRGVAYLALGERNRAIAEFSEAIRLDPNDARNFHDRGVAYSRADDYDRALADLSEAIRLNSAYARAYLARSWVYARKGDDNQAKADRQKAVELDRSLAKNEGAGP